MSTRPWTSVRILTPAVLAVPLLLRIALLVEKQVSLRLVDGHGFATDLVVSLVLVALLVPFHVRTRWAAAVVVPWSIANYASFEFTRVMNALPPWQSATYLGDGTFLNASALAVSRPTLLVAAVVLPVALLWFGERQSRAEARPSKYVAGGASSVLALATFVAFVPASREASRWRQTNVFADNAVDLVRRDGRRAQRAQLSREQQEELDALFRADLDGPVIIGVSERRPNVLLVLLEGISGADLPSVARHHGLTLASPPMARLDELARENVSYRSFVTHQRGTNRGLYASLCGDYDKLGTGVAKMTEHATGPDLACLPAILRRNGYETVFLQAAPLAFMLKDSFMPRIGFSRSIGGEYFTHAYARTNWGVDDRAFFEQTRGFVRTLRAEKRPWFLTLLTVGTHHPYRVPEAFVTPEGEGSFARAARYTDEAVTAFIAGLAADGVLDDTLVLVTSDESHGIEVDAGADDLTMLLSQSLSFMIALTPTRERREVDALFAQSDTALTILDACGLAGEKHAFIGRSALRSYSRERRVFIANQNCRTIGMIDSRQRHAWSCDEHLEACDALELSQPSYVSPKRRITPAQADEVAFLRAAQARAEGDAPSPYRELRLSSDRPIPVAPGEDQILYAGQYLEVPKDASVDVEVEVEALGDRGEVVVSCDLVADAGARLLAKADPRTISAGSVVTLRYSAHASERLQFVEARAMGHASRADPIAVRFKRATLRVSDARSTD